MSPYLRGDISSSTSEASTPPSVAQVKDGPEYEPIAIIGMGCRLPGGIKSPQDLWKLLTEQRSGQCDVPASRWNIDGFYHPNSNRPGSMNTKGGYFIQEDIRQFDNGFFGINNLEATFMDPQQRKLLEVCYECFESAGATLEDISAANIGCYVGNFTIDYITMQAKEADYFHRYNATGMGTTILSNRISHVFNLTGPSVVLDTACSSSLYAVHMACAAIDAGECDSAIAAGANLVQAPEQHLGTMKAGVLSGTSTCHTFDASADGYGRADGIGAVYLKKLSKALEDNDPIRGIIRGSAVNANGKTNGITLPSSDGQEAVIRKAYAKAGLEDKYNETNYVECHGTGTAVGDPIELEAVSRVFKKRPIQAPLQVGSVKTNLGHSEAASGFSSIFKVVMALEKGLIPPTIGVQNINPKIKTEEWGVKIITESTKWPVESLTLAKPTRRAGVNSFGYGGANSHAILESVDNFVPRRKGMSSEALSKVKSTFILPVSANSSSSLEAQLKNLSLLNLEGVNIVDLAYTLGARRSKLSSRAYALAGQETLGENLSPDNFVFPTEGARYAKLPFAFVFTGQGAQWAQMGKELIQEVPSFRKTLVELDNALQKLPHAPSWTLRQAILDPKDTSQINHVTRSQPVCTAIQIAYIQLLRKWGIECEAVIGHSSGEIAAAYAAGLLTATDAIIVAYYRGYVVGNTELPVKGGMIAAGIGKDQAEIEIDTLGLSNEIKVACINSPESVTISGDADGIDKIVSHLQGQGLFARKLNTNDRAYHSHHMALLGQEYEDILIDNLPPSRSWQPDNKVRWVSSVTGQMVTGKIQPSYWRTNLESPVRFSDAVEGLIKGAKYHLIELGPHSALEMPIKQTMTKLNVKAGDFNYSSALTRNKNGVDCLLNLVGNLFLHGHAIDFAQVNYVEASTTSMARHISKYPAHQQGKVIPDLPTYAWTYDTLLWSECRASTEYRDRKYPHHDLLGSQKPGGNGLQTTWRNVLKTEHNPWLLDHKLEDTVVFPGAGYMAMGIEAICQVTDTKPSDPVSIGLRQFQILKALPLSADSNDPGIEVFTQITPLAISATSNSKEWWEFEVTSYKDGISTTHATGKLSIKAPEDVIKPSLVPSNCDLEALAIRNWYGQFTKVGLNYGPNFAALGEIQTPRDKVSQHARAKTQLLQGGGEGKETQSTYLVHPITIDVMLQAGIIASTGGIIKSLRANVPVSIEEAFFQAPSAPPSEPVLIDAETKKIGFSAYMINTCLYDNQDRPCVVLKNVRVTGYQGAAQMDDEQDREPMLRLLWKPDVTTLSSSGLTQYLSSCASSSEDQFAAMVDIISHKNPRVQILDVTNSDDLTERFLNTLRIDNAFKRFRSYSRGNFSPEGELSLEAVDGKQLGKGKLSKSNAQVRYDLIIVGDGLTDSQYGRLTELVASDGIILKMATCPSKALDGFTSICTDTTRGHTLEVSMPLADGKVQKSFDGILIVEEEEQDSFNEALAKHLSTELGQNVKRVLLHDLTKSMITAKSLVISTIELSRPVLSTLTGEEMQSVKCITDNALSLLWLTGGNNMEGSRPDFALMSGLSRALMLEQPSLQITMLDLDVATPTLQTLQNITIVLRQSAESTSPDAEYVQKNDLLHISRMVPEEDMNRSFRDRQGLVPSLTPLSEAKPARLTIGTVGQFDTLAFSRESPDLLDLKPGTVEIEVKSVGLNAKDFYALAGKVNTKDGMCKLECSGIVTRVAGSGIHRLAVGDRVVTMGPGHFLTRETFPEWACQKLQDDEDLHVVTTLPLVFSTALYALHYRAHIQDGESVLIHSAAGGLGNAAIQIAQLANAEIYATVSTEEKKDYLVKTFNLKRENIFNSRDSSFQPAILAATGGRGVDIVLNSLTGDLLHDSWRVCAPWGRFVEVGKQDITDAGKLDMEMFRRNVTFTAFDLSELSDESQPRLNKIASELLAETLSLYRQKKIKAIEPLKVFDVSEITQAYRYFGLGSRIGKIAISLENDASLIPTLPTKHDSKFSPEKTYLMIGCLGGLGGSISKWMVKRGARKFVFVGRSGTDRKPARLLVESLEASGAEVTVVRGDVGVYSDVQAAVAAINGPVGGVIQAAMGLNEALWTTMPIEYWHTGIDPKLIGSWNLYNALEGRTGDLDFFLMTSSVSGSVGTATEGNYCAANYFLDVFARFLRSKGLPGLSIGLGMISEVGYLHENPEIEALLLRKGIQAINEDELLQIIDISLCNKNKTVYDTMASSHVLTGLEPLGLKLLQKAGFSGSNPTLNDPRASVLAAILDSDSDQDLKSGSGMPAELAEALENGHEGQSALEAIVHLIVKRFSNLVLQQIDKIDPTRALSKFGMDSMLAAEFRTWFYQAFKVDVPFLTLLSDATTLNTLGDLVHESIIESQNQS
ncbi:polyketide synthase-nonribosomal peptide synthetase [Penicillium longicatenatum]|uniref:polyketide synthase-nonribosomal peptide synthetase n=1 Tax=Penicillium longicatenatum TaxID=1561947 RepID=UPI002548F5E5|nr:polyketide synthase-nonribosomal peptide synthetase [Penicillium longicatenatum]KAJ5635342.1 polyketide synthase-nonribosomal peptide synthetase [Penicillium longicatenatum]